MRSATLTASAGALTPATADLTGTAAAPNPSLTLAPQSPSTGNFGSLPFGTTSQAQTFVLTNTGNVATGVPQAPAVTGANKDDFSVTGTTCTASLSAAGTCTISVTFTPHTTSSEIAALGVTTPAAGMASTPLSGTGTGCNVATDCPGGEACNTTTHACSNACNGGTTTCNGGCCNGGVCAAGNQNGICGGNGGACVACGNGTPTCSGNACTAACGSGSDGTFIDYNSDGFLDLFVCNGAGPDAGPHLLFKNNGNLNHWLKIDLQGTESNRDGVGARITLKAGKATLYRQYAGQHCMAQNRIPVHFGLRAATTVKSIIIEWPSGVQQELDNIAADQTIAVTEP